MAMLHQGMIRGMLIRPRLISRHLSIGGGQPPEDINSQRGGGHKEEEEERSSEVALAKATTVATNAVQGQRSLPPIIQHQRRGTSSPSDQGRIPNLFSEDLPLDSPYGPSLRPNLLPVGEDGALRQELTGGRYHLPSDLLDFVRMLSQGLLMTRSDRPSEDQDESADSLLPVLLLNHAQLASLPMLETLIQWLAAVTSSPVSLSPLSPVSSSSSISSMSSESSSPYRPSYDNCYLEVDAERILCLGKAVHRLAVKMNPVLSKSAGMGRKEDDSRTDIPSDDNGTHSTGNGNIKHRSGRLMHLNQLILQAYPPPSHPQNANEKADISRTQMRDHFLPGLQVILRQLERHLSPQSAQQSSMASPPIVVYIRGLSSILESEENRRLLKDFLHYYYYHHHNQGSKRAAVLRRCLLVGVDHRPWPVVLLRQQQQQQQHLQARPNRANWEDGDERQPATIDAEDDKLVGEVARYRRLYMRLQRQQMLAVNQKQAAPEDPFGPPTPSAPSTADDSNGSTIGNSMGGSNGGGNLIGVAKWTMPERPTDLYLLDSSSSSSSLVTVHIRGPMMGTMERRQHDQALRETQQAMALKHNCRLLGLAIPQVAKEATSEETNVEDGAMKGSRDDQIVRRFLSHSLLHPDDVRTLKTLSQRDGCGEKDKAEEKNMVEAVQTLAQCRQHQDAAPLSQLPLSLSLNDLSKHEKRFLSCIVHPQQVKDVRMQDIGALEDVKRLLRELVALPIQRPDWFARGILRETTSGVLLFGPPGTGKTLLAKAVAAECGATFLSVHLSAIFDMWVGEGEKNVRGLFGLARRLTPCVVFVDEVDALLQARTAGPAGSRPGHLEVVNEFMAEWDGLHARAANQGVIVMAATNRPFALDDAVLRRLPRRVLVDLPNATARAQILRILLRDDLLDSDVQLQAIADVTEGYTGSDLKSLGRHAALQSRHRGQPRICHADFEQAVRQIAPSLGADMSTLQQLRRWNAKYGEVLPSSDELQGSKDNASLRTRDHARNRSSKLGF